MKAATLVFCGIATTAQCVEIIAHRGASYDAPENTMPAFKLGWDQAADVNELDIHLSKDGQIVILHDDNTRRTAGLDRPVVEQTLSDVRALDAGSWKDARWAGVKVPLLEEVLASIPGQKRLFIEIKCGPEVLPELERVLTTSRVKPEQLVIIGFKIETMRQTKARFPHLPVFWLVSPKKESNGLRPPVAEMIRDAKAAGLDGLNLNYQFAIGADFVAAVKGAGLKLYTWTVDDLAVAQKHAALGIDGITTNRPGWLREGLKAK